MFLFLTPPRCCPCLRHGLWVMPAVVSSDKPRYLGGGDGEPADQRGPLRRDVLAKGKNIYVLSCIIFIYVYVYFKYIFIYTYVYLCIQTTIFLFGGTCLNFCWGCINVCSLLLWVKPVLREDQRGHHVLCSLGICISHSSKMGVVEG